MTSLKDWNPDKSWPDHIINLAIDIANGEDLYGILSDALIDEGLEELASEIREEQICGNFISGRSGRRMTRSYYLGIILNDEYLTRSMWPDEVKRYLRGRKKAPTRK